MVGLRLAGCWSLLLDSQAVLLLVFDNLTFFRLTPSNPYVFRISTLKSLSFTTSSIFDRGHSRIEPILASECDVRGERVDGRAGEGASKGGRHECMRA